MAKPSSERNLELESQSIGLANESLSGIPAPEILASLWIFQDSLRDGRASREIPSEQTQ
jgi:hypothetical protein